MPNTKAAQKALRGARQKRTSNDRRRKAMREVMKRVRTLAGQKKTDEANELLPKAYRSIDKAAKQGVIKDNTAARKKSRLTAFVKKARSAA